MGRPTQSAVTAQPDDLAAGLAMRVAAAALKRYVCAGRQEGHQLAIIAQAADDVVAERALGLLTTPSVREALVGERRRTPGDAELGQALADLGSAQNRLLTLDDDYYVRGVLIESRYRSIKAKLEREIERLRQLIDAGSKQRIVLHQDPRDTGPAPTSPSAGAGAAVDQAGDDSTGPARCPTIDPERVQIVLSPTLRATPLTR